MDGSERLIWLANQNLLFWLDSHCVRSQKAESRFAESDAREKSFAEKKAEELLFVGRRRSQSKVSTFYTALLEQWAKRDGGSSQTLVSGRREFQLNERVSHHPPIMNVRCFREKFSKQKIEVGLASFIQDRRWKQIDRHTRIANYGSKSKLSYDFQSWSDIEIFKKSGVLVKSSIRFAMLNYEKKKPWLRLCPCLRHQERAHRLAMNVNRVGRTDNLRLLRKEPELCLKVSQFSRFAYTTTTILWGIDRGLGNRLWKALSSLVGYEHISLGKRSPSAPFLICCALPGSSYSLLIGVLELLDLDRHILFRILFFNFAGGERLASESPLRLLIHYEVTKKNRRSSGS